MVKRVTDTLTETIPFVANKQKSIDLPTQGFITRIELLLHLNVTTDSGGATPNEDALARLIRSMRIEYPGRKTYFAIPDGRLLKYKNYIDLKQVAEDDLPTSASVTQDIYAKYNIYWGLNPKDPFDPSVVVPAERLSNLRLSVLWGDATDLGTGYTINNGEIIVTIRRYDLEREGERAFEKLVEPRMESAEKSIDEKKSDLGFQINVPIGLVLRETLILITDSADNRSDAEVDEYGVIFTKLDQTPYKVNWKSHVRELYEDLKLKEQIAGLGVLYWRNIARHGEELGFDASRYKYGDIALGFTTAQTGGKIRAVFYQLAPV